MAKKKVKDETQQESVLTEANAKSGKKSASKTETEVKVKSEPASKAEKTPSLAEQYNATPDAVAYAWLLRYPARMQVIIGTMNPQRIRNAAKAADICLTREQWYALYRAAGNELP